MATASTKTSKLRAALKWHGGKSYLARTIIPLLGGHETYVEPFAGGLSVLLNKPAASVEVANDLDPDLINFHRVVAARSGELGEMVEATPYSEESFTSALPFDSPGLDELERARRFMVRNRMSRSGMGKDYGWSDRLRGGQPESLNAWETIRRELPRIGDRLRSVMFLNGPAVDAIRRYDSATTTHYVDPPYVASTRTAKKVYRFEMDDRAHRELLTTLLSCRGRVVLSGYRNPLYDDMLAGWRRIDIDMPNHSGQGKSKQRRVECLWVNEAPPAWQMVMF